MGAKEFRLNIGADILELMKKYGDLPLSNIHILAEMMVKYFEEEGLEIDLEMKGYRWRPSEDYWKKHLCDIRNILRKDRHEYFEYSRPTGSFKGVWKFVSKTEYENLMKWEYSCMSTRTDTYNNRLNDGKIRWKISLPLLAELPLLADKN